MKVIVTGALGVNGVWLLRNLVRRGDDVLALDNRAEEELPPDLIGQVDRQTLDILDDASLDRATHGFGADAIVHLAAVVGVGRADLTYRINAVGALNVLECARRHGVRRFVFASSRAVFDRFAGDYGAPAYKPVPVDFPRSAWPGGARPYSASKIFVEDAGASYAEQYGIEFTAMRFASIYGPGKSARHGATGIHSRIVEDSVRGLPVSIDRGGDQRDDMMYVGDVAQALERAVHADRAIARAYNIGSGRASTLKEFADEVSAALPAAAIRVGDGFDHFGLPDRYGLLDNSAARRDLGYRPEFNLRDGVRDYIRICQQASSSGTPA